MKKSLLIPQGLKKGDCIGIAAPAGQIFDTEKFQQGIAVLREMGFCPVFPRELWPGDTKYLADSDKERAKELMQLFADNTIKAIIAARGGYGCLRLLPYLDFTSIRRHPKMFFGFSDITVLLHQLYARSGCLCFHGPVVTSLSRLDKTARSHFFHAISGKPLAPFRPEKLEVLREGYAATGRLLGGNLCSLLTMLGTQYVPDLTGCILFLEEINEPLYKIDRMLTQLALTGTLKNISGLILGDFSLQNHNDDPLAKLRYTEHIWQRVLEVTKHSSFPIWGNFPIGHITANMTLPFGGQATMDQQTAMLHTLWV